MTSRHESSDPEYSTDRPHVTAGQVAFQAWCGGNSIRWELLNAASKSGWESVATAVLQFASGQR